MRKKTYLFMYLPQGLREQSGWIFIGGMTAIVGLSYAFGFATSVIEKAISDRGLQLWGVSLTVSGSFLIYATIRHHVAFEKLSLRLLSCNTLLYAGWLAVAAPLDRAIMTLALSIGLSIMCELRVIYLKLLLHDKLAAPEKIQGG